jgi:hypothetical protein
MFIVIPFTISTGGADVPPEVPQRLAAENLNEP